MPRVPVAIVGVFSLVPGLYLSPEGSRAGRNYPEHRWYQLGTGSDRFWWSVSVKLGRVRVRKWSKYLVCLWPLWMYFHWFRACTSAQRGPEPVKTIPNIDGVIWEQVWTIFGGLCRSNWSGQGPEVA
jgi:hypothetical protein